MNTDKVIDDFFGEEPRAEVLREMRKALAGRLRALRRQREQETASAQHDALDKDIAALARQVATLETEEVVARFVEDSVKATLAHAPEDEDEEGQT